MKNIDAFSGRPEHTPALRATPLGRGERKIAGGLESPLKRGVPDLSAVALAKAEGRGVFARLPLALLLATSLHAAEPTLTTLTYSGDQAALETVDADIKAAGQDAAKLATVETQLLAVLRKPGATFAARQAAAQRLGLVLAQSAPKPKASDYKPLPTMLADERESDLARLALEPAPGAAIDDILVSALGKTTGRVRLGIMDSILRRHTAAAVPALTKLLQNAEVATSAAAARALAEIATPEAVAALHAVPEPSPRHVAAAKLVASARMPPAAALLMLREMEKSAADTAHRTAAFRLALDLDAGSAARRIAEALSGSDWTPKQAALEAIASSRAADLVPLLTSKLTGWDAPTQAGVIAALGRRHEPAAVAVASAAINHADAEVRAAAITTLGFLPGTRETAALLAKAATGEGELARLARQSLARLNGPDVNAAILAGAERGEPALRAVYVEQLALRNQADALPLLLKARNDADAAVRLAAVGALGDIARPAEIGALIDWTLAAKDEPEQSRALRSVVSTILRQPAKERGGELFAAVDRAPPATAVRLVPALQRIGGKSAAECAARAALRGEAKLADAAVGALARWSDSTAIDSLAVVAAQASGQVRTAAIEGALRYFEKTRDPWKPEFTIAIGKLLEAETPSGTGAPVRKRTLTVLNRANDPAALLLAEQQKNDPALADTARDTADIIRVNTLGRPRVRASANETQARNILDGKTATRWTVPAEGDEWVDVEFRGARPIHRITLDQTSRDAEFPEHYEVYVMDDRATRGSPIASGGGKRGRTVIDLPAGTRGRIVVIKNTAERKDTPWSICELWVD